MSTQNITFADAEVDPIVGRTGASPYAGVITFDEREVDPIVADVVVFDDTEVEPIIGGTRASPYARVITFDDREVGPIVAEVVVFDDTEVEPIIGRIARTSEVRPPSDAPDVAAQRARATARATADPIIVTTGPDDRPGWWPAATSGISFELQGAWLLPPPAGVRAELPLPQTQVLSWLQTHQRQITAAAREFTVDRRAIAGAIAWEALENARTVSLRSVGPGKVHVDADVVVQVEQAGYLPVRTSHERRDLLRHPEPAIRYIAAIMSAKAAIAETFGFQMRNRPDLLTNEYVARSLTEWTEHLIGKTEADLVAAEDMALWTQAHLPFLERGVGAP